MEILKKIVMFVFLLIIFSNISCKRQDFDACEECIAAQRHYFEKLTEYNCNTTITAEARNDVLAKCNNNRVAYLEGLCGGTEVPTYDCDY